MWCLAGVTLGTLVGVLPGLGPIAALSILLPFTYGLSDPVTVIIFLAGIYYGTQYGGSTTAILLNLPGETSCVVTSLDGYAMTCKGRGGAALSIAALSSFLAGSIATVAVALLATPLSQLALWFGSAEYAALMVLGMVASVILIQGSILNGLAMICLGALLGTVGTDTQTGLVRFAADIPELADGFNLAVLVMGMFALGEICYNILHIASRKLASPTLRSLYPTRKELSRSWPAAGRGTALGMILGVLPGGGALISSFASYALEKKISSDPGTFGRGDPAGVAAPEAANNAGAQTSFIPMLSLGLPINPIMALMLGALVMAGIQPGPQVLESNSALFWGLVVSMWLGNLFLLILNMPLIRVWVYLLQIPRSMLYLLIIGVCVFGAYWINNNWFDVWLLMPFAVLGYFFRRIGCEPAPLIMGFVVGAPFEDALRRTLTISGGDWMIFWDRPLSLTFLTISVIMIAAGLFFKSQTSRNQA